MELFAAQDKSDVGRVLRAGTQGFTIGCQVRQLSGPSFGCLVKAQPVDAREAIPRFQRRLAHLGQDVRAPSLGETAALRAAITTATMKGELAFRPDGAPGPSLIHT